MAQLLLHAVAKLHYLRPGQVIVMATPDRNYELKIHDHLLNSLLFGRIIKTFLRAYSFYRPLSRPLPSADRSGQATCTPPPKSCRFSLVPIQVTRSITFIFHDLIIQITFGEEYSITIQAMYVQCNNEVRSRNNCCCGKAISITYWSVCACLRVRACMWVPGRVSVCMRVRARSLANSARNVYAPYCDIICGPSGLNYIFRCEFRKKSYWT